MRILRSPRATFWWLRQLVSSNIQKKYITRNDKSRSKRILTMVASLPFFSAAHLASVREKRTYVNIILSRQVKQGTMVRLRKNLYVAKTYLDEVERKGGYSDYVEFVANKLYSPPYLSLAYVLHEHSMLTGLPWNITSVGLRKTDQFSNELGNFIYHTVKEKLFLGFTGIKKGYFSILKATKAKALFDFLYFRKRLLVNDLAVRELRIHMNVFTKKDLN